MQRLVPALALALAAACGDNLGAPAGTPADAAPAAGPRFVSGPELVLGPNPTAPLSAVLTLATDVPTRVTTALTDADRAGDRALVRAGDALATEHEVMVLGFRPDRDHQLTVEVTDADGNTAAEILAVTAPAPPPGFPAFDLVMIDRARSEPGVTLLMVGRYLVIVDDDGEVVWLYASPDDLPRDGRRLPGGHMLFHLRSWLGLVEIDMLGNVIRRWHPAGFTDGAPGSVAVATDTFHHEVATTAAGNLLTLSTERRVFEGYPRGELDPAPSSEPTAVIGDVIVEFAPGDGAIVRERSVLDLIDPYRVAYDSFTRFWDPLYAARGGGIDWSHGNGITVDPTDQGVVVSLRNQDAVIKVGPDGQLAWILAPHENWSAAHQPYLLSPVGEPFAFQYHQHAPEVLPDGNVLLMDNGNHRASPPDPPLDPTYSRVVEFAIDPVAMQVRQVWEYDAGRALYGSFLGDADLLPVTGNVLATFGGEVRWVVELTHAQPAEEVFLLISDEPVDRAERLPGLYP